GQVWRIDTGGRVSLAAGGLGTTNGIEVSPDGKTLYVNESVQRNVWAFRIGPGGALSGKRLLKKFDDHGFDGMRCDVDGNPFFPLSTPPQAPTRRWPRRSRPENSPGLPKKCTRGQPPAGRPYGETGEMRRPSAGSEPH